ncbi:MAG TPA: cyclic nucleotide-binding domain-containing protein [Desulfuromonadales bacterium]|nr:cyclic nucleotide-binding domain-containing protein [Desulfuromonadales bacterium]
MDPIWSNIFRKTPEQDSLAYFLGHLPFFAELTAKEIAFLENLVHSRTYRAHEIVFEEGDPGSGMYMIRSGSVVIFSRDSQGKEDELARLGPGDFFGETTLTAPVQRSASARTLEATELVGLFRADLLEAIESNPKTASNILFGLTRIVSERLQAASIEIRRLQGMLGGHATPETIET